MRAKLPMTRCRLLEKSDRGERVTKRRRHGILQDISWVILKSNGAFQATASTHYDTNFYYCSSKLPRSEEEGVRYHKGPSRVLPPRLSGAQGLAIEEKAKPIVADCSSENSTTSLYPKGLFQAQGALKIPKSIP